MSSENADQLPELAELSLENVHEPRKLPRYSYTKEFLLSLKDLDTCKKLPSGIDESIISELQQASNSLYEQNRFQGGTYQQSSRRTEYGTGQSNRLESSSSYVRGNQGRWDTRSNESSDKDEAQAERDTFTQEPGKRYPSQPRRSWQHPEHDGLLGRPSGYSGNTSQRTPGNAQLHLNKSNEPYQPPKPYKAPFSRRDKSDMINDETFGSSECPNQDQAEEERRRRELFESMRKEQQRAREKAQKENSNNKKDVGDIDRIAVNIEHSEAVNKNRDVGLGFPQGDSKFLSHSQQSSARPLVPPGFRNPVVDKNPDRTFSEASSSSEICMPQTAKAGVCGNSNLKDGSMERVNNSLETGNHSASAACTSELKIISEGVSTPLESVSEKGKASSPSQEFCDPLSFLVSGLQQPPEPWIGDSLTSELTNEKATETVTNVTSNQDNSTSILDKLFQNANRMNDGSSSKFVEDHVKVDEKTWSPTSSQSSKFSRWFVEEKNVPPEDIPPKGLHSLFSHSAKLESQDSTFDKTMVIDSNPSLLTLESNSATDVNCSTTSTQEIFYPADKPTVSPCVLTCEDLEQYILAEANVNSSNVQPFASESSFIIENAEPQKANVNNLASQHLLSLLQKGGSKESDARLFSKDFGTQNVQYAEECVSSDKAHVAEKSLTLETLFGPSFMKELHSVAAPLSSSVGGAVRTSSHSVNVAEDPFFPVARGPNFVAISEENLSNTKHERRDHRFHEPWQGFEVSQLERSMSAHTSNIDDRPTEVQLPEEESLITLGDSLNHAGLGPFPVENKVNHDEFSLKTSNNVDGNLSILNTIFNSKRTPSQHGAGGPLHNAAYDIADPNLSHQPLFRGPSLFPNQNTQATTAFQQMGSHPHRNPQMRFMASDTIHQDAHHRFTAGMIPQQSHQTLSTQFDPSGHLSMSRNMPPAGNFPPHHLQFPRGVSPSSSSQLPTYFPEGNSMHGFPLNLQQPPYGVGTGLPGPGVGNGLGQQETLEWMHAMELRARSKQAHPVGNSHLPGMYGSELDMAFRYR